MNHRQLPLDVRLREDATFASYVGDAGVRLAGTSGIVYLWGDPGTGRSHLLQALCHDAAANGQAAIYLAGLDAHDANVLADLDALDVVCIDDIDHILGDRSWELALFHLWNAVRDAGHRLVVSARVPPRQLSCVLADLQSRLLGAQALETDSLDDAAKLDLLRQKARRQGFELPDEVGRFILQRADRNMQRLLTLFEKLEVETLRQQRKVTIPFVKRTLEL